MITLTINNRKYQINVDKEMPLLWVLRDILGMNGTKFGCGSGYCGSCTVIVEGIAMKSCVLPVKDLFDKEITTIEALGTDGAHPVQQAWQSENVSQCGYCQPGQIMAAIALLDQTPEQDAMQIEQAMNGILCRCGTYQRIKRAINKASIILTSQHSNEGR